MNSNEYKSISGWIEDVNQIWTNAAIYNNEGTLIYLIAKEMENWFEKMVKKLPRNKDEEWFLLFQKASKSLYDLSVSKPDFSSHTSHLSIE
jgi:hypothetical protein